MTTPIADKAIAAYIQSRLQREYETKPRGHMADLARAAKMSTAHLANAKNKGSIGNDLAEALAKVWGMTMDQLRAEAGVASATEVFVPDEGYPNREVAIELASGKVRLQGEDLTVGAWVGKMRELQTIAGASQSALLYRCETKACRFLFATLASAS